MKTPVSLSLIFLFVFLLTPLVLSGKFSHGTSRDQFSFTGDTTSTSSQHGGHGTTYYRVSGSASITGTAEAYTETDAEYDCEMWLMATGDIVSSSFPSKSNIDTSEHEGIAEVFMDGDASILYLSHVVSKSRKKRYIPFSKKKKRQLSDSLSESYVKGSYSSPTGLCASPEVYGSLSGDLLNFVGTKSLRPLTFESNENKACADSPDDGSETVATELCFRGRNCQKPMTATSLYDHRVECPEYVWVREGVVVRGKRFFEKKKPCPVYWWTCDDDPKKPHTLNQCIRSHVPASELHLEERYVDENGNPVDPNTETRPCGHLLSASGDHSLQASCSVTNNRGQRCIITNFYACQSHTHTYPTAIRRCPRVLLGGFNMRVGSIHSINVCSKGGYLTAGDDHRSTCRLRHQYWDCDPASVEKHKARTCARCSNTYQNCQGNSNPCISGRGHSETADPPAEAPSTPQPDPSPPSETSPTTSPEESTPTENEEQEREEEETAPARPTAVCGSGHTYFTDVSYTRSRHRDRTCTRCSQTYQNCSNHSSACQGSRWHTEDPSATPTPSPPTETPSPPNDNEDTDDDTDDAPDAPSVPEPTRLKCGHLSTAEGNHIKQASCTSQDSNGNYCTATGFYQCRHTSHTYPAPPPPPTVVCPADSWTNCDGTTSHASTCTGGHTYYTCGTANAWHQDRTCTRCSQTYQNCGNSATACQGSKWHTETPQVVLVACGAASWTGCTSQLTSSTEHQVSCSGGHSYWTCGTAVAWHKDRTCSRCSQTYQNCGNSATACQGSRWHTE